MALKYHFCLGPCANDVAVYDFQQALPTLERTGVAAGDAGWMKYSGTAGLIAAYQVDVLDVDVPSTSGFMWDILYQYSRTIPSGGYKGIWEMNVSYPVTPYGFPPVSTGNAEVYLRLIDDGGTTKYELLETDTEYASGFPTTTTSLGKSGSYPANTSRTITPRIDVAAGKVYVFIDQSATADIVGTLVFTSKIAGTPNYHAHGGGANAGGQSKIMLIPASSAVIDGYWSSWGRVSSTVAADLNETTQYPECHGHGSNAQGNYDAWADVGGHAKWVEWSDLVADGLNDGLATYLWIGQGTGKQTSKLENRTYANAVKGATQIIFALETDAAKNIPWEGLLRYSASDKALTLPSPTDAVFRTFNMGWDSLPGGAAWSAPVTFGGVGTAVEIGANRTGNGDATNLRATAIYLEGFALGTTKKAPADPPAVTRRRTGGALGGVNAIRF